MDRNPHNVHEKKRFPFFNLTNERVVDLFSYAKYLYYIGIIETILYAVSILGIPLVGFTIMGTWFSNNTSSDTIDIYLRWRYLVTFITLVIICLLSLFTNWPKCSTTMTIKNEKEVWNTFCKPRGAPFALFFSLLVIVVIEVWAIYVTEMYRVKYKELMGKRGEHGYNDDNDDNDEGNDEGEGEEQMTVKSAEIINS